MRLDHNSKQKPRPDLNACACTARIFLCFARALLILTAISLITMPLTQHLWTWDRFLHGGRDFELTTLMILSFLALVLVLSRNLKQCIDSLLSALCILALACQKRLPFRITRPASKFRTEYVTCSDTGTFSTPLLI
jgi:hypothetical protein